MPRSIALVHDYLTQRGGAERVGRAGAAFLAEAQRESAIRVRLRPQAQAHYKRWTEAWPAAQEIEGLHATETALEVARIRSTKFRAADRRA
jgi:hypothetical protein